MPPVLGLIQLLAIGFVVGLTMLIVYTAWLLTHPHRRTYAWAISRSQPGDPGELDEPLAFESDEIDTEHGITPIWDIVGRDPQGPTVLMTHGWGSSRQGALKRIAGVIDHSARVIAWDLPGHGEAPGSARMGSDEHLDAMRVLDSIGPCEQGLVLMGWSMGAGVSLKLAQAIQDTADLRGVICEAIYNQPVTPARAVLALRGMPHRLNLSPAIALIGTRLGVGARWRGFDRKVIAQQVRVPLLLVHGDQDPVSPIADAQAVQRHAPNATLCTVKGAGHNNLWSDEVYRSQCIDAIGKFMQSQRRAGSHDAAPAQP